MPPTSVQKPILDMDLAIARMVRDRSLAQEAQIKRFIHSPGEAAACTILTFEVPDPRTTPSHSLQVYLRSHPGLEMVCWLPEIRPSYSVLLRPKAPYVRSKAPARSRHNR